MFSEKYPASAALILLIATSLKDAVAALQPGEAILEKISGFSNLAPGIISFIPLAGSLSAEMVALKLNMGDDVLAVEMLVSDLSFSSDKAKNVIAAAFPILENIAAMEPSVVALVAAVKS